MSRVEWGNKTIETERSALDRINERRAIDRLARRMSPLSRMLPRRTERHHGYLMRQNLRRDSLFDLVNRCTTLGLQFHSVRRLRRDTTITVTRCSFGEINFFVKGWRG